MSGRNVYTWSLIIALGGFLFGFDTAVISGAEQAIQRYWNLSTVEHGLTISIALIGTIIGALTGAIPSDYLGRKKTLYGIAGLYLLSSLGTAFSTHWGFFLLFRLLGGFGVGASSVTAPIYISEISPAGERGRLVGMFQFNVVLGIVISYLSNYLIGLAGPLSWLPGSASSSWHGSSSSWRLMLAVQAIPSALFLFLLRFIPESPRWLILQKGKTAEARAIFDRIDPSTAEALTRDIDANARLAEETGARGSGIRRARIVNWEGKGSHEAPPLFSAAFKTPIILAVLFAFFNQVSGINAIIYYAPRIFEMTGLGRSSSLLSTAGIGVVNFLFTLLAMNFIDRIGRKVLMLIGSVGLIGTLGLVAISFYTRHFNGWAVPVLLFVYIAFFAFSQGAVIWVFIAEIFPNKVRAKGQTLGSTTHWVMAAVIAFSFPYLAEKAGGGNTFLFFTVMMVLQLLFVWKFMPETKGRSLEQIELTMVVH